MSLLRLPTSLLLGLLPLAASAAMDPSYQAIRQARADGRQLTLTAPMTLERDAFRFDFESGTFHFLAPCDGRTFGAVFLGQGQFRLAPATEDERRHLAFVSGQEGLETLKDSFDTLVLLFADDTAEEIGLQGEVRQGAPEGRVASALDALIDRQRKDFKTNFEVRLLEDLLNTPISKSGVFMAYLNGKSLPASIAVVDPRGVEALHTGLTGGEDTVLLVSGDVNGGFWYASDRAGELKAKRRSPYKPTVDAQHYAVTTEVRKNEELLGETVARLEAASAVRVVPLSLASTLRVKDAAYRKADAGDWVPVPFIQEREKEDADLAVVLPEIVPKGTVFEVKVSYAGKEVIFDLGEDIYAVLARTSWYANAGIFTDLATFDLTYKVPKGNDVVSVGRQASAEVVGEQMVSVWKALQPIRVAGFNYGKFNQIAQVDEVSGLTVQVFANKKAVEFQSFENDATLAEVENQADSLGVVDVGPRESTGRRSPIKVAQGVAIDGINGARLFHSYFGPLNQTHVAIAQQSSAFFGQSWPSLIYLPFSAFMTGTARKTIGLAGGGYQDFIENVGFHEMAHQWWGHHVGWESYRDVWLSEGFAEFSAALAVQRTQGWAEYGKLWEKARERILSKSGSTVPVYQVGPISRGGRLASGKSQGAPNILIYEKGAFVLHMLRMMMRDPSQAEQDAHFIALMQDFTASFAGKSPSTEDFKKVVERHVVPAMNATGDGKMDWFFNQWIYGTELPIIKSNLKAQKLSGDEYQITGTVSVEGVSPDFRLLVPLSADWGKGRIAMFGRLPFTGPATRPVDMKVRFPEKPKLVLANALQEVLTRE